MSWIPTPRNVPRFILVVRCQFSLLLPQRGREGKLNDPDRKLDKLIGRARRQRDRG